MASRRAKQAFVQLIGLKDNEESTSGNKRSSSSVAEDGHTADSQGTTDWSVHQGREAGREVAAETQPSPRKRPKRHGKPQGNLESAKTSKISVDAPSNQGQHSNRLRARRMTRCTNGIVQHRATDRKSSTKAQETKEQRLWQNKSSVPVKQTSDKPAHQETPIAEEKIPATETERPDVKASMKTVKPRRSSRMNAGKNLRRLLLFEDANDAGLDSESDDDSTGEDRSCYSNDSDNDNVNDVTADGDDACEDEEYHDAADDVVYDVFPASSPKGRDKLFCSLGYSYVLKKKSNSDEKNYWRCSLHSCKGPPSCLACVMQVGDKFYRSKQPHTHETASKSDEERGTSTTPSTSATGQNLPTPGQGETQQNNSEGLQQHRYNEASGVTYSVKPSASQRRKDKLFDSLGFIYSFSRKSEKGDKILWRCPVRSTNTGENCRVTVMQVGDRFHRSRDHHAHDRPTTSGKKRASNSSLGSKHKTSRMTAARRQYRRSKLQRKRSAGKDTGENSGPSSKLMKLRGTWQEISDGSMAYQVVPGGTQRKKDKLVDSLGFSYVLRGQRRKDSRTVWRCKAYGGQLGYCPAQVIQDGDRFLRSRSGHNHEEPIRRPCRVARQLKEHGSSEHAENPALHRRNYKRTKWRASRILGRSTTTTASSASPQSSGSSVKRETDANETVDRHEMSEEDPDEIQYEVIPSSSTRGRDKLFDSRGFSYVVRHFSKSGDRVLWRCPVHNDKIRYCPATVIQEGDRFYRSEKDHVHQCNFGPVLAVASPESEMYRIAQTKQRTRSEVLTSSAASERDIKGEGILKTKKSKTSAAVAETSVETPAPQDEEMVDDVIGDYRIVRSCSMRGQNKLFDNEGYSYALKYKQKDGKIRWRCTIRNKKYKYCPASVLQDGENCERVGGPHTHPPKDGEEVMNIITQKLRQAVEEQPNTASSVLIEDVLQQFLQEMPCPTLPSVHRLSRIVRYHRARVREKTGDDSGPMDPKLSNYRLVGRRVMRTCDSAVAMLASELNAQELGTAEEVEVGNGFFDGWKIISTVTASGENLCTFQKQESGV